jgi:hypothetical protein
MPINWKDDAAIAFLSTKGRKILAPRLARAVFYFFIVFLLARSQGHFFAATPLHLATLAFLMALGSRTVWAADGLIVLLAASLIVPKNWLE